MPNEFSDNTTESPLPVLLPEETLIDSREVTVSPPKRLPSSIKELRRLAGVPVGEPVENGPVLASLGLEDSVESDEALHSYAEILKYIRTLHKHIQIVECTYVKTIHRFKRRRAERDKHPPETRLQLTGNSYRPQP